MVHIVGVGANKLLEPPLAQKLVSVKGFARFTQVKNNAGAMFAKKLGLSLCCGFNGIAFYTVRLPDKSLIAAKGAANNAYLYNSRI